MNLTRPEAQEWVIETLDEESNAVSGNAFKRHGRISELRQGELSFHVSITIQSTSRSTHTTSPSSCPICTNKQQRSFIRLLLTYPFAKTKSYEILDPTSHDQTPCNACRKAGEVFCSTCGGHGRVKCNQCNSDGYHVTQRKCDCRNGEGNPNPHCRVCNGTGKVQQKRECGACRGTGHTVCPECNESGLMDCRQCEGQGFRHQHETDDYRFQREIDAIGLPDSWDTNPQEIGKQLTWDDNQLRLENYPSAEFSIQTKARSAVFLVIKYGEDQYNIMIVEGSSEPEVVWDPSTDYPKTSLRKKLSDLKSRIFS